MKTEYCRFLFFTGKGGVGKTSLACATAVKIADAGKKVLLISTDPASNLEDVLQTPVNEQILVHKDIPTLFAINIDPDISADQYRNRVIEPMKGIATAEAIQSVREGLLGACTTEIASFDEFSRFITGEDSTDQYDHIIFDTAPTGHTIRLLELPAAWDSFLEENPSGASCIGPSSALHSSKERYKKVISSLRNPAETTFYMVSRADHAALKEAARTSVELKELGMENQQLLLNGIFSAIDKTDKIAAKMEQIAANNLAAMPSALAALPQTHFPLLPYNVLGPEKLRSMLDKELQRKIINFEISTASPAIQKLKNIRDLVDELENNGNTGLIMTMGKGGVGKTIAAATIATMLASRGHKVLLTTTDPAAHVRDVISQLPVVPDNLTVERIDPKVETQNYIDKIMAQKGGNLSTEGKRLLLEDLKSPCTEEVAVFHAFSKAIHIAKRQFVVMDTAPTGHTLLLLDTTGSYHREVLKNTALDPARISTPYMLLQDKNFAKILLVALPETTPMREAAALQNDLKRAGIEPYAWIVNQCLSELHDLKDPLLKKRASNELDIIGYIAQSLSNRTFGIPYVLEEKLLPALLSIYLNTTLKKQAN